MSSSFGRNIRFTLFGESHGAAIGGVAEGLPTGEEIDLAALQAFMERRAPGRSPTGSARRERDEVQVLSGLYRGRTSGSPLAVIIENRDMRPGDYEGIQDIPRPGHGDYSAALRYGGFADPRGGGHLSGRLTAGLCALGGICMQILARRGIVIGSHLSRCAGIEDAPVDSMAVTPEQLAAAAARPLPVFDGEAGSRMMEAILAAGAEGDSVGGVVEAFALGVPVGLGSPMFGGVENRMAEAIFGIPAVRGVEFGVGFGAAELRGSGNNDCFVLKDGAVSTATNRHGGVLGGITTGMPLVLRAAIKPTPSIAMPQTTLDRAAGEQRVLEVHGRHDPCIAQRAAPCVEAAMAAVLLDMLLDGEYMRL